MKTKKKRLLSALLATALICCLLPKTAHAAGKTELDVSEGSITIADDRTTGYDSSGHEVSEPFNSEGYIINADPNDYTGNTISVRTTQPVSITLNGVFIDVALNQNSCALDMVVGANVTLTLADGTMNWLQSGSSCAGIHVPAGATLVIQGGGALYATGFEDGAGIGGNSVESGGGGDSGAIIIKSGTINAQGGGRGAGIGGGGSPNAGSGGDGGSVTISGGTVYATGGGASFGGGGFGAAIGGGFGGGILSESGGSRAPGSLSLAGYGAYEWLNESRSPEKQFTADAYTYDNAPGFFGIRPLPVITPASGVYAAPVTVSVTPVAAANPANNDDVTYFTYTTDGTDPDIITPATQATAQLCDESFSVIPTAAGVRVRVRTTELAGGRVYISSVVEATYRLGTPATESDANSWRGMPDAENQDTVRVQNLRYSDVKSVTALDPADGDYKLLVQGKAGAPLFAVDVQIDGSPNDNMIVSFFVGREHAGEAYTILHRLADGSVEVHHVTCAANGWIAAHVNELSPFVVYAGTVNAPAGTAAARTLSDENPDTGANDAVALAVALGTLAFIGCCAAGKKRK